MNTFRTLIIPADKVELTRAIASALSPAAEGMWTTPLVPVGSTEVSHFISTGNISDEFAYLVPEQVWELQNDSWVLVDSIQGNPEDVVAGCLAAGLEVSIDQVQAIFDTADVTSQEPFVALARLGLELQQETSN